jgi:transposase
MAGFIAGADRDQPMLLPALVDDYITADAAVRVIDAFVASLDMHALGFGRPRPALTGRPGYDPRGLLKLYIYGYLNGLRSSRRLEKACTINLEVIWLLRKLAPDFKTIADFRRDNHCGVTGACKAFVRFCRQAGLFAAAVAVIDGSKVRAAASRRQVIEQAELEAELVALDRQIGDYLLALDAADANETDDTSSQQTRAALQALKDEREELLELAQCDSGRGAHTGGARRTRGAADGIGQGGQAAVVQPPDCG